MSHNPHIADYEVENAARLMHHPESAVRALAALVMRLSENRPPLGSLAHADYALTLARRYATRGKSVFEGTVLGDQQRSRLIDALLSGRRANDR